MPEPFSFDVFLSHNSKDKAAVRGSVRRGREKGCSSGRVRIGFSRAG